MVKKIFLVLFLVALATCAGLVIKTVNLDCPEEPGIPVDKHILVIRSSRCCDIALDKKGNHYYCYMVDQQNNLRALITDSKLTPVKGLEEDILEFYLLVKKEIESDGGIEKLIEKFSESEICQCPEHRERH